jgi:hypothetical protein
VVVAVKAYVNLYRSGFGYHGHGYEDRQVAENQAEPDAVAVAYEVEIPDPPADEPGGVAEMLMMLADTTRDMETSSPADAERIEWALAEIARLQGIINRRTYYLRMMEMSAQEIAGDIQSALEDPS